MTVEQANEIISKLNGKKILLTGNHDKKYDPNLFEEICDFKTISIDNTYFVLMHYPIMSWPKMHSGSIHVHGHIHSDELYNLQNQENGIKRYDAGVDANNFYPVSAKQIIDFFQ
jgi:calcineurin-like phosphoesterase family protein